MMSLGSMLPAITIATLALAYKFFRLPKQNPQIVRNMLYPCNKPLVIAHRAGASEAPENTLIAIETAHSNGATAVEIDIDFTKDGVPILHHDDEVDRTTNGSGKLEHLLYEETQTLNAAHRMKFTQTKDGQQEILSEKIPTLFEAVDLCERYNLMIDLDIKSNSMQVTKALKQILHTHPNASKYILATSFYPNILYRIRHDCPEVATGLIWRYHFFSHTLSGLPKHVWYIQPFAEILDKLSEIAVHAILPDFLGVSVLVMNKNHLSKKYVEEWKNRGYEIVAWTVNSPFEKEYLLKDLKIPVITDYMLYSEDFIEQNN